jgi:hypothetical protein
MKVYVVMEDDRGMGVSVEAVYLSKEKAEAHAAQSRHYFMEESELDIFDASGNVELDLVMGPAVSKVFY